MAESEPRDLIRRFHEHRMLRSPHDSVWQTISDVATEHKRSFSGSISRSGGDWTKQNYDPVAQIACNRFVSIFLGLLTSPYDRWLKLDLYGEKASHETRSFFDWVEEAFYATFRAHGFYRVSGGVYQSAGFFGNAMPMIDERPYAGAHGFQGFRFLDIPLEQCIFVEDGNGEVRHVMRFVDWTAYQIISYFGDGADIPEQVRQYIDRPDRKFLCIHEIRPQNPDMTVTKYDSQWVIEEYGHTIRYQELEGNPYIPVRMPVTGGDTYGSGPAYDCLSAIRTLNYYAYLRRENFGFKASPRFVMNEQMRLTGWETAGPGALLIASGEVGQNNLRELSDNTPPDYFRQMAQPEHDAVRRAFYVDQIEFWTERPQDMKAGVASEMGARNRIILSPLLTAMNQSYVVAAIARCLQVFLGAVANRTGPSRVEIPQQVVRSGINIDIVGPLAIAQKAARLAGYRDFLADSSAVIQLYPETRAEMNGQRTLRFLAETNYIPAEIMNSPEEVRAILEAQQQQAAAQQQLDALSQGAPAMLDIARASKELSGA